MKDEIIETIRTTLSLTPSEVNEATPLEQVARDSMDIVELVAVLGDRYKVAIEPAKMNHIKTVGDIVAYVIANKGSALGKQPLESY